MDLVCQQWTWPNEAHNRRRDVVTRTKFAHTELAKIHVVFLSKSSNFCREWNVRAKKHRFMVAGDQSLYMALICLQHHHIRLKLQIYRWFNPKEKTSLFRIIFIQLLCFVLCCLWMLRLGFAVCGHTKHWQKKLIEWL